MEGQRPPFDPERYAAENGQFDETVTYGNRLVPFLRDAFPTDGVMREPKYDSVMGVHVSGGTNGYAVLFSESPEVDFVTVTKQHGEITGIHARLKSSSDDFYLGGDALKDFLAGDAVETDSCSS